MHKICSTCKKENLLSNFYKKSSAKSGLDSSCKSCVLKRNNEYKKNNHAKILAYKRADWDKNKDTYNKKRFSYRIENNEKIKAQKKLFYNENKDAILEQQSIYYQKNKIKHNEKTRTYYKKNKASILEKQKEYTKKNRLRYNAIIRKYKLKLKQARVALTKIQEEQIKQFYSACPKGYHVDHIIPLQHENVSGLHVLDNLQYLPSSDNCRKGNKFDGTLENTSWKNV